MPTQLREHVPTEEEKRTALEMLVCAMHPGQPPEDVESIGAVEALHDAVDQLSKNERGRQAMADFLALLENGALSLDGDNWRALITLARVGSLGYAGSLRAALEPFAGNPEAVCPVCGEPCVFCARETAKEGGARC